MCALKKKLLWLDINTFPFIRVTWTFYSPTSLKNVSLLLTSLLGSKQTVLERCVFYLVLHSVLRPAVCGLQAAVKSNILEKSAVKAGGNQPGPSIFHTRVCVCVCVCVCVLIAQSRPTLCNPMDCSPPGYSVRGILQAWILEWIAVSFSRGSSQPGSNPGLLHCR